MKCEICKDTGYVELGKFPMPSLKLCLELKLDISEYFKICDCQKDNIMETYAQEIKWTKYNKQQQKVIIRGCNSVDEARAKIMVWAYDNGWTNPKWWQWWRKNDTKFSTSDLNKIRIRMEIK